MRIEASGNLLTAGSRPWLRIAPCGALRQSRGRAFRICHGACSLGKVLRHESALLDVSYDTHDLHRIRGGPHASEIDQPGRGRRRTAVGTYLNDDDSPPLWRSSVARIPARAATGSPACGNNPLGRLLTIRRGALLGSGIGSPMIANRPPGVHCLYWRQLTALTDGNPGLGREPLNEARKERVLRSGVG